MIKDPKKNGDAAYVRKLEQKSFTLMKSKFFFKNKYPYSLNLLMKYIF